MCTHPYSTCVHTLTPHVYTPLLHMCTHPYSTCVHTLTPHVYTPLLHMCTHPYSTCVHTLTPIFQYANLFFCLIKSVSKFWSSTECSAFQTIGSSQVHRHSLTLWIVACEYMCMYVYVCMCVCVCMCTCVCMRFSLWSGLSPTGLVINNVKRGDGTGGSGGRGL